MDNQIRQAKLRDEGDIGSTTSATFGIYPYPAKFIPHIPAYIFSNFSKPGMKAFDPFAGSGTVGLIAKIYGCHYELWDLNPMLDHIHTASLLEPKDINVKKIITQIKSYKDAFIPDWSNLNYWYNENFLSFLYNIWGFYHSLDNNYLKELICIPLLRITRYFSYDDEGRQKLSKSKKSKERIDKLLGMNWKNKFYIMLENEMNNLINGIQDYKKLNPLNVDNCIKIGIDTFSENLMENKDILITSPPYLQSQQYIRQAKNDLFWLGYKEKYIKKLQKLEIPYRDITPISINSNIYDERREIIQEDRFKELYDNYFWGVLGSLERLSKKIDECLFIFVGRSSLRGETVEMDKIFTEHFISIGWNHIETIEDKINSRRMFSYGENPATGIKDKRTKSEFLIILKK